MSLKTTMPKTKRESGCLALFALPFAVAGIGIGLWLGSDILAQRRMRNWQETSAKILRAELKTNWDSEGTTHETCRAEYTYQFGGRQYTGSRVSICNGNDESGSYQYYQLSEYQKSGNSFPCYVNPDNPAESVIFRDLRWDAIVGKGLGAFMFGSAGGWMLIVALLAYRKASGRIAMAALHPNEPWLCRRQWADGRITSSNAATAVGLLAFAIFWNVISWSVLFLVLDMPRRDGPVVLLSILFPAVGLGLLFWVGILFLRWHKYGRSVFEMAAVPAVIGGQLAGVIRTAAKIEPEEGVRLTLNCIQQTTTKGEEYDAISEKTVWRSEQIVACSMSEDDPERSAISVLFEIPRRCSPTDETDVKNQTIWRLNVSAKTPGLDYSASFEVPVFKPRGEVKEVETC